MKIDERGMQCPIPVIQAKKALEGCRAGEILEVIVDNGIAVQNLQKLAAHKGLESSYERISDKEFVVAIVAGEKNAGEDGSESGSEGPAGTDRGTEASEAAPELPAEDTIRKGMTVVLSARYMGSGDDALGAVLMKGFVYALAQQSVLPETVLLYNSGAFLSCENSDNLEDLLSLEARGVEILTCGTCLKHYGLTQSLRVGNVTNMYDIAEKMTKSALLVRP